jgi:hypothetical protein
MQQYFKFRKRLAAPRPQRLKARSVHELTRKVTGFDFSFVKFERKRQTKI